jgi:RNA recognition motif-containing protein
MLYFSALRLLHLPRAGQFQPLPFHAMKAKLWVSNLDQQVTENELEALFSKYGQVSEVSLADESEGGRPTGSALLIMTDEASAERAIDALDGHQFRRRYMSVTWFDDDDDIPTHDYDHEDIDFESEDWDEDWSDDWQDDDDVKKDPARQGQSAAAVDEWDD